MKEKPNKAFAVERKEPRPLKSSVMSTMIKEPSGKKICATCGIDVGKNDTELVNNYWSFLYRYKKVYRCPKCFRKRQIIIYTLILLLILTFGYEIVKSL